MIGFLSIWNRFSAYAILFLLVVSGVYASDVQTLTSPSGARSLGMGEVGTALANDEDVVYYNPAGLGLRNSRWEGGAATLFNEQLYPSFKMKEWYHRHFAGYYQFPDTSVNGIALDFNYINYGFPEVNDGETGMFFGKYRSYEYVVSAVWGFNLERFGKKNHSIGLELKYLYSVMNYFSKGDCVGQDFAVDLGYLWQFLPGARFGATLQNIGPKITYVSGSSGIPLPFTINMAMAYCGSVHSASGSSLCDFSAEIRVNKTMLHNDSLSVTTHSFGKVRALSVTPLFPATASSAPDVESDGFNVHVGCEARLLNTVSLRGGFLYNGATQMDEYHFGLGFQLLNHFQFDGYFISAPDKGISSSARDGQVGISLTFYRIFSWNAKDADWMKQP